MADRTGVSIDTVPMPERPVRVVIPTEVAFDLKKFQKAMEGLAERLGCRPCLSGADCTFRLERDFIVNPKTLGVEPAGGGIR